jgi:hypothetical protein
MELSSSDFIVRPDAARLKCDRAINAETETVKRGPEFPL